MRLGDSRKLGWRCRLELVKRESVCLISDPETHRDFCLAADCAEATIGETRIMF